MKLKDILNEKYKSNIESRWKNAKDLESDLIQYVNDMNPRFNMQQTEKEYQKIRMALLNAAELVMKNQR